LPRIVRNALGSSRMVEFEIRDKQVVVRPVPSVAGGLSAYARKVRPLAEVRDEVWKEVAHARGQNRPS
jgi:hypothetical protein